VLEAKLGHRLRVDPLQRRRRRPVWVRALEHVDDLELLPVAIEVPVDVAQDRHRSPEELLECPLRDAQVLVGEAVELDRGKRPAVLGLREQHAPGGSHKQPVDA
jgi:hypothetical protein